MYDMLNFVLNRLWVFNQFYPERAIFAIRRIFPPSDPEISLKRMKNLIAVFVKWKYNFSIQKVKPIIFQVETVRGCNLNCVMCGAGELSLKMMSFEKFKKISEKFPEAFITILNFLGEPFLSKDIIKMIQYSQQKSCVILFSNLTILPHPEDLVNSGLFEINISIDSFDKEKYEFIRKSGELKKIFKELKFNENEFDIKSKNGKSEDGKQEEKIILRNGITGSEKSKSTLEKVVENLKTLIRTRNKLKKNLPIISINSVFAKETKEDAEDIIKNAIDLGVDRVKFQRLAFDVPGVFHTPDSTDFLFLCKLKEKYKNQIEIIFANFDHASELKGYCFYAHFMVLVDVFGNIFPCCMPPIFENTELSKFGNIENTDIIKALERRQNFINNFRDNPPQFCKKCYLYIRR